MNKMVYALLGVVGLVMLVTIGLLVAMFTGLITPAGMEGAEPTEEVQEEEPEGEPRYFAFDEPLTANVAGDNGTRFVQAQVELMVYSDDALDALGRHEPVLRDRLLGVLAEYGREAGTTTEGKEELRRRWLETINQTLAEQGVDEEVQDIYLTELVMQ